MDTENVTDGDVVEVPAKISWAKRKALAMQESLMILKGMNFATAFLSFILSFAPSVVISPVIATLATFTVLVPLGVFLGIIVSSGDISWWESILSGKLGAIAVGIGAMGLILFIQQWFRISRAAYWWTRRQWVLSVRESLGIFTPLGVVAFWAWAGPYIIPPLAKIVVPLAVGSGAMTLLSGTTFNYLGFIQANAVAAAVLLGAWFIILGCTYRFANLLLDQILRLRGTSEELDPQIKSKWEPETVGEFVSMVVSVIFASTCAWWLTRYGDSLAWSTIYGIIGFVISGFIAASQSHHVGFAVARLTAKIQKLEEYERDRIARNHRYHGHKLERYLDR
jgi:hypothetical protein